MPHSHICAKPGTHQVFPVGALVLALRNGNATVPGGSAFADEDEDATNEVAMLSSNKIDKTPAAQTAANVALGQFLKACRIMLSARLTEGLTSRRATLLLPRMATAHFVEGVGIPLYELVNIGPGKRRRGSQHSLSFRELPMAPLSDGNLRSCLACHLGPGPRM